MAVHRGETPDSPVAPAPPAATGVRRMGALIECRDKCKVWVVVVVREGGRGRERRGGEGNELGKALFSLNTKKSEAPVHLNQRRQLAANFRPENVSEATTQAFCLWSRAAAKNRRALKVPLPSIVASGRTTRSLPPPPPLCFPAIVYSPFAARLSG